MNRLRMFWSRVRALVTAGRRDADLDTELGAHLEMLADDYRRRGLSPAAARDAARRDFGGVDQIKEAYREQRSLPAIEHFVRDAQFGVRLLRRSPGFAAAAIVSLALGIGATCAIFTLVNAALIKELPVREPARVVAVNGYLSPAAAAPGSALPADWQRNLHDLSYPLFSELVSSGQRALSSIAASGGLNVRRLVINGQTIDPSTMNAAYASANYFSMLGVGAAFGRVFTEADSSRPGEGAVAVVGYGFWQRQMGGDPAAVGQTILINDVPLTIIGVAPPEFFGDRLGMVRNLWVPILMQPRLGSGNDLERRTSNFFRTLGRLAPAVSEEQAIAELTGVYRELKAREIASGSGTLISRARPEQYRLLVAGGMDGLNGGARDRFKRPFLVLQGVTLMVLLIACCNVANLLIARGAARRKEIAIRMAIGAGRARVVRQLLVESLLIGATGAGIGLLVANWAANALVAFFGVGVFELGLDRNVLAVALSLALVTTVFFGVLPAIQNTSGGHAPSTLVSSFRERGATPRRRLARGLVVVQVGLSLWLLIGAGLLLRTLQNFNTLDVGLARRNIALVSLQSTKPIDRGLAFQEAVTARLLTVPGVTSAGFAAYGLFTGGANTAPVSVPDSAVQPANDGEVRRNHVSPNYFRALGMALIRGREFTDRDADGAPKVAILNETMARHYFGQADPVGKRVYFPGLDQQRRYIPFDRGLDKADPVEVIGVVRDARFDNLRDPVRRMTYLPLAQGGRTNALLLRVSGSPAGLADHVRQVVAAVSPDLIVASFTTLEDQIDRTLGNERSVAVLLAIFGGLAILLACVGLYGVMAYGVARRRGEIGVRMALGASRAAVQTMILRETLLLVILGVVLGVPAALGTTHFVQSLLFGLSPTDAPTIAGMAAVIVAVGALAGWIPALRAARVDAATALRCE